MIQAIWGWLTQAIWGWLTLLVVATLVGLLVAAIRKTLDFARWLRAGRRSLPPQDQELPGLLPASHPLFQALALRGVVHGGRRLRVTRVLGDAWTIRVVGESDHGETEVIRYRLPEGILHMVRTGDWSSLGDLDLKEVPLDPSGTQTGIAD